MGYIGILLVAILVYFFVARVGGLALQLTGVESEVARFQALSALTGTGFTTTEAERVVRHRARRRIITVLIIVGNAGLITIIGTMIVSFAQVTGYAALFIRLGILIAGILVLYRLIVASKVGNRVITWLLKPLMKRALMSVPEVEEIFNVEKDWGVNLITVKGRSKNIGLSLADVTAEEDMEILAIDRTESTLTQPRSGDKILEGDRLLVYASRKALKRLLE